MRALVAVILVAIVARADRAPEASAAPWDAWREIIRPPGGDLEYWRTWVVAHEAYEHAIRHPELANFTLDDVRSEMQPHAPAFATDPWGRRMRLVVRGPYHLVVTCAGPDGRFDTEDDFWTNTLGWQ